MAQTITNQASLSYAYNGTTGTALSNVATAILDDVLSTSKDSAQTTYQAGQQITYTANLVNTGATALTNITVTDDLGSYLVGTTTVTPLTFNPTALFYVNGVLNNTLTTATTANSVTFTIPSLPAGAVAYILYNATVNGNAPLATTSTITNTITVANATLVAPLTASNTITVADYANVTISKSMSPTTLTDGSLITYTFTLYNYGNTEATGVVLSDTFSPAPTGITVTVDGTLVDATNYTYTGGVLTLPTGTTYSITLPPATITQNPTTGATTVVPSTSTIVVTGTI